MAILADENTTIIIQGITGREAVTFTKDSLDYGAKILAGVTPGRGGREVHGVPVFDTVREAVKGKRVDACVISVPPSFVKGAALETLDNGIKLLVILTERAPRKDVAEVIAWAKEEGARVVGPNSLGILSPEKTKVGMVGGRLESVRKAYMPGPVGLISRSGGMTTEIANLLTLNGIGQSTCVSIGGDPIVGSTYSDLVPLFEADPETKAVVIFCEPGGTSEEYFSRFYKEKQLHIPVVAFVAGRFADEMPGVRFGHAATIVEGSRGSTQGKIEAFREAGIQVAEEFSQIISILNGILK